MSFEVIPCMLEFDYPLDYESPDLRRRPDLYRVGRDLPGRGGMPITQVGANTARALDDGCHRRRMP